MKCHACGEHLSDHPLLCPNCGGDLETAHDADRETEHDADRETGPDTDPRTQPVTDLDAAGGQIEAAGSQGATAGPVRADGGQRGMGSSGGSAGGGAGGTAGGPAAGNGGQDAGGSGGGSGGGGIQATITELPLLTGVFAGFLAGIAVVLVGVGVALAVPPGRFPFGTMDVATVSVVDLHFGLGAHIVPRFVFARFQQFAPPSTLLGLLYLLPPLFLYTGGKVVSSLAPDAESAPEALLNGATVVLGYLPVVFVVLLLLPGGAVQVRIATPLLLAGIVYPLLFGALGGVAQHHFPADARRVGVGYGVLLILAVAFLLFLATFVIAGSLTIADRLVLTTLLLGAVQIQSGVGTLVGGLVLAVLAGIAAFAIGFLRTWRADRRQTIVEGLTRPLTAAWTYALGIAVLVTAIPVFADSYAARELHLGGLVSDAASEFARANLAAIGDFVELVLVGSVVFPVALGCAGGLIAALVQHRRGARAEQAAAAGGGGGAAVPGAGGDKTGPIASGGGGVTDSGSVAGGGVTDSGSGGESTGPTADDEPLGPSAGGGRTGPEPDADSADSATSSEGSPGAARSDEGSSDAAVEGSTGSAGVGSPADEAVGGGQGAGGESSDEQGRGDTDEVGPDTGHSDDGVTDSEDSDGGDADSEDFDDDDPDSGETDSGETDSGETDSGETDSGETDSGEMDSADADVGADGFDWGLDDEDSADDGESNNDRD